MSANVVKDKGELNLNSMPTHTETQNADELPIEVVLAIVYTMAKRLEKAGLAQILTGHTPKQEVVTYIRMIGVDLDPDKGFVLAIPASIGNPAKNANTDPEGAE